MSKIEYREFTITYRTDGHCSLIYWNSIFINAVAGEITKDGRTDVDKAKSYIDGIL